MQRQNYIRTKRRGIALVVAMIFIAVFMAMAAGMVSMSSANARAAVNLQSGNLARSTAESGVELLRYWMRHISVPGTAATKSEAYEHTLEELETMLNAKGIEALSDGAGNLWIGPVTIEGDRTFSAFLSLGNSQGVDIQVTGTAEGLSRTLASGFTFGLTSEVGKYLGFDFGVATKGPLSLGNLLLDGVNLSVEADVYIESLDTANALKLKNGQIAGDVKIVNPNGLVDWSGGQSSIGGVKDKSTAVSKHVTVGVPAADFPIPNPGYFKQYVTGSTLSTPNVTYNNTTLTNVRIAAGTNPKFTGNTIIKGVLYIEQPNVVEFGGNADITGIVVGNGDLSDNTRTNKIDFKGTVTSSSVSQLPADQFSQLRQETGTFLMAPGFGVSFGGNFGTLNGCIVANGVTTYGNAGGEVGGSIINYSTEPMNLSGDDIRFNKSGIKDVPAGFTLKVANTWTINYTPSKYTEVIACGL